MKPGDLVINKNSESGEMGTFLKYCTSGDYIYAKVLWADRGVGSIQPSLLKPATEPDELTNEQLENVKGGMSRAVYSIWRSKLLNERK